MAALLHGHRQRPAHPFGEQREPLGGDGPADAFQGLDEGGVVFQPVPVGIDDGVVDTGTYVRSGTVGHGAQDWSRLGGAAAS